MTKPVGWRQQPARHSLAARGVKTGRASGVPSRGTLPTTHERALIINDIMRRYSTSRETAEAIYRWLREHDPDSIAVGRSNDSDVDRVSYPEDDVVNKAIDALKIPRYEFKIIAGRGEMGDMNWGVNFKGLPQDRLDKWEKELKKHVGEEVFLSGGGGAGVSSVKLVGVHQEVWDKNTGKMGLRAELQRLETRPLQYKKGEIFDPWMDSWQVSILERVN